MTSNNQPHPYIKYDPSLPGLKKYRCTVCSGSRGMREYERHVLSLPHADAVARYIAQEQQDEADQIFFQQAEYSIPPIEHSSPPSPTPNNPDGNKDTPDRRPSPLSFLRSLEDGDPLGLYDDSDHSDDGIDFNSLRLAFEALEDKQEDDGSEHGSKLAQSFGLSLTPGGGKEFVMGGLEKRGPTPLCVQQSGSDFNWQSFTSVTLHNGQKVEAKDFIVQTSQLDKLIRYGSSKVLLQVQAKVVLKTCTRGRIVPYYTMREVVLSDEVLKANKSIGQVDSIWKQQGVASSQAKVVLKTCTRGRIVPYYTMREVVLSDEVVCKDVKLPAACARHC
ncbi:uncharacterized protein MELLADRAFT_102716 [Melampsora larici-populina 98AG31]|uniref:Uncharacterized protein n=1 Tax=Melampsora larici-populina (strain 98AG31 / pathotype 3-4-7) TaxID=747676 RepID=F4R957_MELLP|nr:uncharacterized protein MELLADRAFT_102716 [Melampsora larici-populina 98AG31]EGG10925.1 hypothetical protein MELLADRAFT_102716 [Melampsora larici-populina 98AG31]